MSYNQSNVEVISGTPATFGPKSEGWIIGGIRADNYTQYWWGIEGTNFIIPPYTTGWKRDFRPSQTLLKLIRGPAFPVITSPDNRVFITAYEWNGSEPTIGDDDGQPFNLTNVLDALITAINALGTKIDLTNTTLASTNTKLDSVNTNLGTLNTTMTGTNTRLDTVNTNLSTLNTTLTTTNSLLNLLGAGFVRQILVGTLEFASDGVNHNVVAAVAAKKHVILAWSVSPSYVASGLAAGNTWGPRSQTAVYLTDGTSAFSDKGMISPSHPESYKQYWPFGVTCSTNTAIAVNAHADDGSNPRLEATVFYYDQ